MQLLSLQDVKGNSRLIPTMIRLPENIKCKAQEIAKQNGTNETSVYRSAIIFFIDSNFTDSKNEEKQR